MYRWNCSEPWRIPTICPVFAGSLRKSTQIASLEFLVGPRVRLSLPLLFCSPRVSSMRYLHTMGRVTDLTASLALYCEALGLREIRRIDNEKRPLHAGVPGGAGRRARAGRARPGNWDPESTGSGALSVTWRTKSTTSMRPASA